jgi:Fe-S-cluster-containing hydrogenase component 2
MANEKERRSGMEASGSAPERLKATDAVEAELKKEKEGQSQILDVTRRVFLVGTGTAAAGLVVGGVIGYGVAPEEVQVGSPEAPFPSLWIGRNPEACTGCKLCEIACSKEKEGKVWPAASRIRVCQYPPCVEFPVTCYLCGPDAECIKGCEIEALSWNPVTSRIDVDVEKCLRTAEDMGCIACNEACPGKTIFWHPVSQAPLVCDLCDGDVPCVQVCPTNALMVKGTNAAPAPPEEIARGLGRMYDLPLSRQEGVPEPPRRPRASEG